MNLEASVDSGGSVNTSWRRRGIVISATAILLALPIASFANHWAWKSDGDDTEGVTDIKRASVQVPQHKPGDKGKAKCRIDFFGNPATKDIQGRCEFDTKGGPKKDILILSHMNGGDKYGTYGSTWKGDYVTGSFPASWSRKDGDLILSIARKRLKGRASHMRWKVSAEAVSDRVKDWAPSLNGWFRFNWKN